MNDIKVSNSVVMPQVSPGGEKKTEERSGNTLPKVDVKSEGVKAEQQAQAVDVAKEVETKELQEGLAQVNEYVQNVNRDLQFT